MYAGMAEGGREPVDPNHVQPVEVEVNSTNFKVALYFLPRTPGHARGPGRTGTGQKRGYAHPRAVLEQSAREQAMTKIPQTTQEVRHLPSIGTTNGRLFLVIRRSCSDLTDLTVPPPPPPPSFPLAPPGIGRGARLLALLQSSPPPHLAPSRVSKDHLPTAVVQPQRIPPPPPELDDDDLLQLEQLALDDADLDLANLWWD